MTKRTKQTLRLTFMVTLGLAVLLLGWGYDDFAGFFAHPARSGLVAVAVLGLLVFLLLNIDFEMDRRGSRPVGKQRWLLAGMRALALSLIIWLSYSDRREIFILPGPDWLRYAGIVLYTAGSVVVLFALKALGRQHSGYITLQDNHKLVQSGIYSMIRHPIYLRGLLVGIGLPLVFRSLLTPLLFALIVVIVAVRIRAEEKLLADEFGEEFETYRKRTWRLVPYLH